MLRLGGRWGVGSVRVGKRYGWWFVSSVFVVLAFFLSFCRATHCELVGRSGTSIVYNACP